MKIRFLQLDNTNRKQLGSGLLVLNKKFIRMLPLCLSVILAGCATSALDLAPATADKEWAPPAGSLAAQQQASAVAGTELALTNPGVYSRQIYSLPELIDLAQRTNPSTRSAWERARQAALGVGIAEATYLPVITANVIGGIHHNRAPLPIPLGSERYFDTDLKGVMPFVALQWLVFDFGGRSAVLTAAQQVSLAANYEFNALHQQVVFDVTRTYHAYSAARSNRRVAIQTLGNSRTVVEAVRARRKNGLATVVDVAQAEQLVAQAELRTVTTKGAEQDAYQALLATIGISPTSDLQIEDISGRRLPVSAAKPIQTMIDIALAQRPDIRAGYANLKVAKSGVDLAKSTFGPKVALYGGLSTHTTNLHVSGLPSIGAKGRSADLFVGATLPLYDSGLRAAQLKAAESRVTAAEHDFSRLKDLAAREIVVASNALTTAVQSQAAAAKLVQAAAKTYEAALEAYRNGLGTITETAVAQNGLLDARMAAADAHAAAFTAAASLAFVLGASTRAPQ